MVEFPISGVETYWWLPAVVAFLIASITSTGGVTGAFIILPFQISFLGYTSPGASPTNLLYNVFAIPTGVWRYHRERRMVWPLAWLTIAGTLPGTALGAIIRIKYLPDPVAFKLFAGLVLLYLGMRLLQDIVKARRGVRSRPAVGIFEVEPLGYSLKSVGYRFNGTDYHAPTVAIFLISLVVGVVGGAYGIGGGAVLSPVLVSIFQLPVHSVAGAALLGTFVTSIAGVIFYMLAGMLLNPDNAMVMPDWLLGLSFGVGGALGVYLGARLQRFVPANLIKAVLIAALLFIAGKYIIGYFQ